MMILKRVIYDDAECDDINVYFYWVLMSIKHSSEHFLWIHPFNSHSNPKNWLVLLFSYFK